MLHTLLSTLKNNTSNDEFASRRKHARRACDKCIAVIMGKSFPVSDWSPGGVLITADDRLFSNGQDIDFQLKFKLRNTILDIDHTGNVIRKGNGQVAIQFENLSKGIRKLFQQVMDDYVAREFANSQNS
jgi:hypothetical protein